MLTFSSLLQKASNFPNIYISETSKDFSPEDSKICFLVLWKDAWYSLKRKMQSYKRRRKSTMWRVTGSCQPGHTGAISPADKGWHVSRRQQTFLVSAWEVKSMDNYITF